MINRFDGEYRFLSNFFPSPIRYDGILYTTVEHAYQAQKTLDIGERRKIANLRSPFSAKKVGKVIMLRKDWHKVSLNIMYQLVLLKFTSHPELAKDLLATGEQEIVEGNDWGDTFWGKVDGKGLNHLGRILMRVRDELLLTQKAKSL